LLLAAADDIPIKIYMFVPKTTKCLSRINPKRKIYNENNKNWCLLNAKTRKVKKRKTEEEAPDWH
jgi:hypothetical protein